MADDGKDAAERRAWGDAVRLWVPLLISCCAILLTVYSAYATRRHNRIMVRPKLDWRATFDADTGQVQVSVVNVGFGPAVVKNVTLFHGGESLGPADGPACAKLDALLGRDSDAWDTRCFSMGRELYLRQGDEVTVYGSRAADAASGPGPALDLDPIGVSADYCSFYDECWQLSPK